MDKDILRVLLHYLQSKKIQLEGDGYVATLEKAIEDLEEKINERQ